MKRLRATDVLLNMRAITLIVLCLAGSAFAGNPYDPYDPWRVPELLRPPPVLTAQPTPPERTGTGLIITGVSLGAMGYLESVVYASALFVQSSQFRTRTPDASTYLMYVPLLGPVISQLMFFGCNNCGGGFFGNLDPLRLLVTLTSTVPQVLGFIFTLKGARNLSTDAPALSLRPGTAGAPLGLTLVFRN